MEATASPIFLSLASISKIWVETSTVASCFESLSTATLRSTVADSSETSGVVR